MRSKKYFLGFLILACMGLVNNFCNAQTVDSIKYENGYLYYHEYGSKNLPTVILLTGGPGNFYYQLEEMAITMRPKFRCILLEQRGTGKSIPTPFDSTTINVLSITKDLKTLMDGLNQLSYKSKSLSFLRGFGRKNCYGLESNNGRFEENWRIL